jgi:hypothetical protein
MIPKNALKYTRGVWKVRGLTLFRVGTLWRRGDDLFFEALPLATDALLTTLHPLLENVLQTVDNFEISCLGTPFFMFEKAHKSHGTKSGLYGGCSNGVLPIHFFQVEHRIQFRSRPVPFLGFSNHENGVPRQEISMWLTVCSTFSRSGWSVVRRVSLAKGGTSKKRPSPHLHKVTPRSNKVSPRNLQTALVDTDLYLYSYYVFWTVATHFNPCVPSAITVFMKVIHARSVLDTQRHWDYYFTFVYNSFSCGVYSHGYVCVFSPRHGASSYFAWRRRPQAMRDSCEYIE